MLAAAAAQSVGMIGAIRQSVIQGAQGITQVGFLRGILQRLAQRAHAAVWRLQIVELVEQVTELLVLRGAILQRADIADGLHAGDDIAELVDVIAKILAILCDVLVR